MLRCVLILCLRANLPFQAALETELCLKENAVQELAYRFGNAQARQSKPEQKPLLRSGLTPIRDLLDAFPLFISMHQNVRVLAKCACTQI